MAARPEARPVEAVRCLVCATTLGEPIYASPAARSLTSTCVTAPGPAVVRACVACGHVQTAELPDLAAFYDTAYNILVASEEEDQLYDVVAGTRIYRLEHQVATLLAKVPLGEGARVLDHGSAKAASLRKLVAKRPDLVPHVFDVSEAYRGFWDAFVPRGQQATYAVPAAWRGRFDLVTSFFVLEHAADPVGLLTELAGLLAPGGRLFLVVPNVETNVADLVVADHVNHFTRPSLKRALAQAGLRAIALDDQAYRGAFVVVAAPGAGEAEPAGDAAARVQAIAGYWAALGERVRAFEAASGECPAAIYGAGFYGAFLANCLAHPERVRCFLDRGAWRQQQALQGKPILAPEALPAEVALLYVGLNPAIAREAIAGLDGWRGRDLPAFYP